MEFTPTGSRAIEDTCRPAEQRHGPGEVIRHRGIAELLLGAVMASTCGAASPVVLTVHAGVPWRDGGFDVDARLLHADGRQQRWLAELRQAGAVVACAHVVVEADLPSSSYVPWHSGMRPMATGNDDGFAHCLRIARLCDRDAQSHADEDGLIPLWSTIRFLRDLGYLARAQVPLALSRTREERFDALHACELEVFEAGARVATLTTVYERKHA